MELSTIKDVFDRVAKKQKLSSSKTQEVIALLSGEVEQALVKLQAANNEGSSSVDHKSVLLALSNKLSEIAPLNQLEGPQKELTLSLNKCTKILEKQFNPDISKAFRNVDFDVHTVNQIVASHFYRQGMFDIGDSFINEACEPPEVISLKNPFIEMYELLEALKSRNLEPAIRWAASNRDQLLLNGSSLELKLHRLQFIEILQNETIESALTYARAHISHFATVHMGEIQRLMGCLLWQGRVEMSPYADLLSPTQWESVGEELTDQFCSLLGQSYKSPLAVAIAAGVQGLPMLLKLSNLMAAKKQEWQTMKQLPVPIDLGKEFQFHSVFVCPVSKDQGSEENPPMLMPCAHVLCKQTIVKLSKSSTRTFKCPYCPLEATVAQCRQLHI